jgi:hypothetical protein
MLPLLTLTVMELVLQAGQLAKSYVEGNALFISVKVIEPGDKLPA